MNPIVDITERAARLASRMIKEGHNLQVSRLIHHMNMLNNLLTKQLTSSEFVNPLEISRELACVYFNALSLEHWYPYTWIAFTELLNKIEVQLDIPESDRHES